MEINLSNKDKVWLKLMKIGFYFGCHQFPERSFFINKYQFPVCARCTGVFLGQLIMIIQLVVINVNINVYIYIFFLAIMLIDWILQFAKIKESTNLRRFITGLLAGYGLIGVFYQAYKFFI